MEVVDKKQEKEAARYGGCCSQWVPVGKGEIIAGGPYMMLV